jgi:phosphoribosylanthranilate isomerase
MIVQIYEIQSPADAEQIVAQGVDHIGSVLLSSVDWKNSAIKKTVDIVQSAGRKSSLIPLFTDADLIARVVDYYQPDIIHFCETLPINGSIHHALNTIIARQQTIRSRYPGLEIMRSIPIASAGLGNRVASLEMAAEFEPFSDWFLTDTLLLNGNQDNHHVQPVAGYVGITGQTCDWIVASELVSQCNIPVILAGGIGPHNVSAGIDQVRPAGVDSCTRTNAVDQDGRPIRFKKDLEKVRALVASARKARI